MLFESLHFTSVYSSCTAVEMMIGYLHNGQFV